MDDYGHWPECEVCPATFRTQRACNQHMNARGHWAPRYECETCTSSFRLQSAATKHMNAMKHWAPKVSCETCNNKFQTQSAADQHMKALSHYRNYCKSCDRRFDNENNLRMHLRSKIHRGRDVSCPFCKVGYTTASGLSHHLETSSCPNAPSLSRETIYRMVRERDPSGVITNKQIGWVEEKNATYSANLRSWNGNGYECYLCHRQFKSLPALNQHLNSSAHKQQVYHCPNSGCAKPFAALAGLFNHLESESCSFMRFERVQQSLGNVLQGGRLISF
ncbi:hypothetical protein ASPVEDRAFT_133608 [Aspergillus versicolor CBS 583.65]|uniref:C2H2-type domain-containing protein n=1 Tax=Aspergillus versicolor CBS 583.65 TaxID=1036611 RepID=A0A1L9PNT0_ASPVE|nr:uncharacterized protein ASPVEDRAFT_133608 [Aspergillus versicolor CBS 583.65]OJJ03184.1 hypothetical protein ASPVEDRAFT_133608 [Aspergillus versicolor CBS 583.65]